MPTLSLIIQLFLIGSTHRIAYLITIDAEDAKDCFAPLAMTTVDGVTAE